MNSISSGTASWPSQPSNVDMNCFTDMLHSVMAVGILNIASLLPGQGHFEIACRRADVSTVS